MATLEEEIGDLKTKIAGYEDKMEAVTTSEDKKMYADLIIAKETRLNTLLQQQQQQPQAQAGGGGQGQGGPHSTENIPFLLDIDSTLLTRCKNVGQDDVYLENEEYINDSFECIPLFFEFQRDHCVVVFRHGVGAFLRFLTSKGRVCLVTHACEAYANRLARFLEKQTECGQLLVRCVRKPELKVPPLLSDNCTPSTPLLIVDDKPARWERVCEAQTTEISPLTEDNFRNDVELRRLLVLVNEAEFSSSIVKFDLANAAKVRGDLNFENPIPKSQLFQCLRCRKWMALISEDGNADSVNYSPCPSCARHFDSSSDEEEEIVKVK